MACELCKGPRPGEDLLYRDSEFWVALCDTCKVPMLVYNRHREWDPDTLNRAIHIMEDLFPDYKVDTARRKIPQHPHLHSRPG